MIFWGLYINEVDAFKFEDILKAISGDDRVIILDEMQPKFLCDCSRERMELAVNAMSSEEKKKIIEKEGFIEVKCSFCGKVLFQDPEAK